MYIIIYKLRHPVKGKIWQAHVRIFEDLTLAEAAQEEVAKQFKGPACIMYVEEPLTLADND